MSDKILTVRDTLSYVKRIREYLATDRATAADREKFKKLAAKVVNTAIDEAHSLKSLRGRSSDELGPKTKAKVRKLQGYFESRLG